MLNIEEIDNTIEELENGATTFDNCMKLASLYIVKEHNSTPAQTMVTGTVEGELNDILPQYRIYCATKRRYQLNELSDKAVQSAMKDLCTEIKEFIHVLYSSTDTPQEREQIRDLIDELQGTF